MKWLILLPLLLWAVTAGAIVVFGLLVIWAIYAIVFAIARAAIE